MSVTATYSTIFHAIGIKQFRMLLGAPREQPRRVTSALSDPSGRASPAAGPADHGPAAAAEARSRVRAAIMPGMSLSTLRNGGTGDGT